LYLLQIKSTIKYADNEIIAVMLIGLVVQLEISEWNQYYCFYLSYHSR